MTEAKRAAMSIAIANTTEAIKLLRTALGLASGAAPIGNGCGVALYDARRMAEDAKIKMERTLKGMR